MPEGPGQCRSPAETTRRTHCSSRLFARYFGSCLRYYAPLKPEHWAYISGGSTGLFQLATLALSRLPAAAGQMPRLGMSHSPPLFHATPGAWTRSSRPSLAVPRNFVAFGKIDARTNWTGTRRIFT